MFRTSCWDEWHTNQYLHQRINVRPSVRRRYLLPARNGPGPSSPSAAIILSQSVALALVPFARDRAWEAPGRARVALRDNTVVGI